MKQWTNEDMIKAITNVNNQSMSIKHASKSFKVPRSTLQRFLKNQKANNVNPEDVVLTKLGSKPVLGIDIERESTMPCTKPKVLSRNVMRQWTNEDMIKAITNVNNQSMSIKHASKSFKVPRSTLQRFLKNQKANNVNPEDVVLTKLGRKPVLGIDIERESTMPCTKPKVLSRNVMKQWTNEDMIKAITNVNNQSMSIKHASKSFKVPRSILQRFLKNQKANNVNPEDVVLTKLGRKPVLGIDIEQELEAKNEEFLPADKDLDTDEIGQFTPDDNDATCIFCDHRFSEDNTGELWVRCIMCRLWAHEQCSGAEKDDYVCDFCR
ncbi:unnamed protein product [Acanthoscelides obtectus]|uniref:HTH psq-type domain-containing protein n=1 Tax=Acanthoscelides obtectus TaxID=200917 RepID=A0A9P0PDZ8_ACAOB|nr:unnamed protein product [Acanthoscelides obtectus]CAK1628647.1 hypothetical protein AOBTE_LOCUS5325 [Acanthoscelides obtectus]